MNKSDPDHPTWKLIRKVARSKNPANVKPGRSLETLAAARKPDLVWRLRRRDRLEFVYNLGWVLHAAIWELDDADEALIEHIGSMPETLFNLSHDSGKWQGPYMFWDLVIMGNEEALRPGGAKGHLYAPLAAALAQQRFMNDKAIRASAEHGLYHFSRIMPSEGPRGRHP